MNLNYAGNVLKSKVRNELRKVGLAESVTSVLDKHEDLGEMYDELVMGEGNYEEVQEKFQATVKKNPAMKNEIANKVRQNIYDLSPEYVLGTLELMASSGGLGEDEQEMINMLLAEYKESGDVRVLREGTMKIAEFQITKL